MKVTIIWEGCDITTIKGANALKIALRWLHTNPECLAAVFGNNLYLKDKALIEDYINGLKRGYENRRGINDCNIL